MDLLQTFEVAPTFLNCPSLVDIRLLPGVPGGHAAVAWEAPGTVVPRNFKVVRHWVPWFEQVPEYLGKIDATMHTWPVGGHHDGDLTLSVPDGGASVTVRQPASEAADLDLPMTIGVVTDDAACLQVTDQGVWHTLLPQRLRLVPMGANLRAYLATLVPDGEVLPYQWCVRALRQYWVGAVFVLNQRAGVYCPCGRDTMRHYPILEGLPPDESLPAVST
ncbi:hypothetical protein [Embleya sp. AB8]|uniref:hypothetical protein n=1 Tax=Embleya sp. AB8 TaxID=3156304 RepID=UPI003C74A2C6